MAARGHISLKTQLAAALLGYVDEHGKPVIPHEHAKQMTADQIISLFQRDHYPIRKIDDGPDEPWNLVFRFIPAHRKKTAEVDKPQIAKADRIRKTQATHRSRLAEKTETDRSYAHDWVMNRLSDPPRGEHPRRPRFPKGRKLRSRGFQRRGK